MTKVFEADSTVQKWDDDYYTPISETLYDNAIGDMVAMMGPPAGATILDAGCGPGVHSIRIAKLGFKIHAIDISETMLNHARLRVQNAGLTDFVRFDQMDLTNLSLADSSVDYAFSWGVITHIPEAERAFEEFARVIRPGGRLALYLTNESAIDHKLERVARTFLRKPQTSIRKSLGNATVYRMNNEDLWVWQFSSSALMLHLERLGFVLKYRRAGEFSELQRRFSGRFRNMLLQANNVAYNLRAPAHLAVSNLYVFERTDSDPLK